MPQPARSIEQGQVKWFDQQVGVELVSEELAAVDDVPIGTEIAAKVTDANKLNTWVRRNAKQSNIDFAAAKGEKVRVKFTSPTKCVLLFPQQGLKAKLDFEGSDEELQAILDWPGSLESGE